MLIMPEKLRQKIAAIKKNDKNNIKPNIIKKSADKIFIILFVMSLVLIIITNYSYKFGIIYPSYVYVISMLYGIKYFFIPSLILAILSVVLDANLKEKNIIIRIILSVFIILCGSILLSVVIGRGTIPTINLIKQEIVQKDLNFELTKKEYDGSSSKNRNYSLVFKTHNKELVEFDVDSMFYNSIQIGEKIIVDRYYGVFKIELYKNIRIVN